MPKKTSYTITPAKALSAKCDAYFKACDDNTETREQPDHKNGGKVVLTVPAPIPYTKHGLAYALGLSNTAAMMKMAEQKPLHFTLARAFLKIERQHAEHVANPETRNSRGVEFSLQNNYNWASRQVVEVVEAMDRLIDSMGDIIVKYVSPDKKQECLNSVLQAVEAIKAVRRPGQRVGAA